MTKAGKLLPIAAAIALCLVMCGCGGISASPSVSPAMFLLEHKNPESIPSTNQSLTLAGSGLSAQLQPAQ
jgi:hypothetical protein